MAQWQHGGGFSVDAAVRIEAAARGPPLGDLPDAGPGTFDPRAQPAPEYEFDQRIAW